MAHTHTLPYRWLVVSMPLLITACCLKNPNVYFSTGTTVGLEATPPTNETPPHVTFGYKRNELALIPVTKLDKELPESSSTDFDSAALRKRENSPKATTSTTKSSWVQSESSHTSGARGKTEPSNAPSERGCARIPISTQIQEDGIPNKAQDAFSVLAAFHLAVNWFGPAKIEQHFATGCAATYLIQGITEEEEDKRQATEALAEVEEAKDLVRSTENDVARLEKAATAFEKEAEHLKRQIGTNENDLADPTTKGKDTGALERKLKLLARQAGELESRAMRFDSAAENQNRLTDAKTKAQSALQKADKATRSEVVRPQMQAVKEKASRLIEKINDGEAGISTRFKEARCMLRKAQGFPDECEARSKSTESP